MRNSSNVVSPNNASNEGSSFIVFAYEKSWRFIFHLSAAFPYTCLQHNESNDAGGHMSAMKLFSAALVFAAAFMAPALAAGSDVAKYPRLDVATGAVVMKHDSVGVFDSRMRFQAGDLFRPVLPSHRESEI